MTRWALLALYVAGYGWGFRWMLAAARRAYANRGSLMWQPNFRGGVELDGMGATFWALGVPLVPLGWPLLMLGLWAWGLVTRRSPVQ